MDPSIIQDFRLPKEAGAVATEAAVPPNTQHQPPGPMGTRAPGTGSAPFEWGKPSNPAPQHPMTANGEPDIDAILQKLPPGMRALLDQADAPAGAAAPAPASAAPPPEAIAMLRANPTPAEMQEFDVAFGAGAAQKVLNGAR